jgi:AcrR family transcriptional regulator
VTFFRYFPTKEDVVLSDDYDPLITALLAQTPAERPVPQRIRDALLQGLAEIYETDRDALLAQNQLIAATPALRSRLWGDQMATQQLLLDALGPSPADQGSRLRARVTVAACLAATTTAVLTWADNNGTPELPELINQAFDVLAQLEQSNPTPHAT